MSDVPGGPTPPPPPPPPPPSAMGGPQGTIPPKSLGEILSAAFNIYKANASKLMLIVAIVVVPLSFISALFTGVIFAGTEHTVVGTDIVVVDQSFGVFFAGWLIATVIGFIISFVLRQRSCGRPHRRRSEIPWTPSKASVRLQAIGQRHLALAPGRPRDPGRPHPADHPRPDLRGVPRVAMPVLIVENRRGTEAMSRSWNLVKGQFWHALGVIFVATIIAGIMRGIIGRSVAARGSCGGSSPPSRRS